ncbi:MAG: phosphoadenylyl-sulfate reductase [Gemmatimonadetes bacterium]|nr:phosphoadenylyl-sulfate reductase [Gemmatimonadota bacterium]
MSDEELADLNERFERAHPSDILAWVDERFGRGAALMCSFGLEDVALVDMFWRVNPAARLMTLDTWRLPTETYTLMDQIKARYKVEIEVFCPDVEAVRSMVAERGFNLFYRGVEDRKLCCRIRKVEPLNRALEGLGAWVSGLRRDQGMERGRIVIVEWDQPHSAYKVNPLANWTFEQVWQYVRERDVPYNQLHDRGYPSIGCAPCTRAVAPGEDLRAGRWWWEGDPDAKECGLHILAPAGR